VHRALRVVAQGHAVSRQQGDVSEGQRGREQESFENGESGVRGTDNDDTRIDNHLKRKRREENEDKRERENETQANKATRMNKKREKRGQTFGLARRARVNKNKVKGSSFEVSEEEEDEEEDCCLLSEEEEEESLLSFDSTKVKIEKTRKSGTQRCARTSMKR
jgi:hypothetical protein